MEFNSLRDRLADGLDFWTKAHPEVRPSGEGGTWGLMPSSDAMPARMTARAQLRAYCLRFV